MKGIVVVVGVTVLIVAVATAGCLFADGVSAAQIKAYTLQSVEDVISYRYSMEMTTTTTTITGDDGASTMTGSGTGNGAVDLVNRKLMMEMTSAGNSGGIETESTLSYYFVDYVMYMKMDFMGTEQWIKMDFSEMDIPWNTYWKNYDQMEMLTAVLEISDVERLDDEVVNGVDCYGLKIVPDVDRLVEILMSQLGSVTGMPQGMQLSDTVKDFTLTFWISKDTNFIMKAYEYISVDTSSFQYSASMDMNVEVTIMFTEYNDAVNIELPEDAENAISYVDYFSSLVPTT